MRSRDRPRDPFLVGNERDSIRPNFAAGDTPRALSLETRLFFSHFSGGNACNPAVFLPSSDLDATRNGHNLVYTRSIERVT